MAHRDGDFNADTIKRLGERVNLLCSRPGCQAQTKGAHTSPDKTASVGKACHILGASPGGPRYDANQTDEARKSIDNGIWLCSNCGTLIDSDEERFPPSVLREWKLNAEAEAAAAIGVPRGRTGTDVVVVQLGKIPVGATAQLSYVPLGRRPHRSAHDAQIEWTALDTQTSTIRFTSRMGSHGERTYTVPISDVQAAWPAADGTWNVRVSGYLDSQIDAPYRYVSASSVTPSVRMVPQDAEEQLPPSDPGGPEGFIDPYVGLSPGDPGFIDPYGAMGPGDPGFIDPHRSVLRPRRSR